MAVLPCTEPLWVGPTWKKFFQPGKQNEFVSTSTFINTHWAALTQLYHQALGTIKDNFIISLCSHRKLTQQDLLKTTALATASWRVSWARQRKQVWLKKQELSLWSGEKTCQQPLPFSSSICHTSPSPSRKTKIAAMNQNKLPMDLFLCL